VRGILIQGSLIFAGALLIEVAIWHSKVDFHLLLDNLFWFVGGLLSSLWTWDENESIRCSRELNKQIASRD
jgi:hypothetical protein